MLELKNVTKHYPVGDSVVEALKGVSISFRKSEFVSILGPSGCGKTTLLNIIGGLDRYTAGDIVINGVSTKLYDDSDWDTYRNHSVGFVFQSYNLIPHQTVLANVELALTLSGVSPKERKERATSALERVGLGDQIKKLPAQLSGGQMQRVAIARAIVNDPEIILADEPTGALDTETSIQVMDILKELAKEKLVIMVTHNPDLAEQYSSRIINLKDGLVKDDSNSFQYTAKDKEKLIENTASNAQIKKKKPSMSFLTALSLSLKNLSTKKARTILTSFAGSIGIIGIALILSLSTGFSTYIDEVQRDTLTNYPVSITKSTLDTTYLASSFFEANKAPNAEKFPKGDSVTPNKMLSGMIESLSQTYGTNDLISFKKYIEENKHLFDQDKISAITYSYSFNFNLYQKEKDGYRKVNYMHSNVEDYLPEDMDNTIKNIFKSFYTDFRSAMATSTWGEMVGNNQLLKLQYDMLSGDWPTQNGPDKDGAWPLLVVVDQYNRIPDYALYMMGLLSDEEVKYILSEMAYSIQYKVGQDGIETEEEKKELIQSILNDKFNGLKPYSNDIKFKDLVGKTYSAVLNPEYYTEATQAELDAGDYGITLDGKHKVFLNKSGDQAFLDETVKNATKIKICGIVRLKEGAAGGALSQSIYYTPALTEYLIDKTKEIPAVKAQLEYYDEYGKIQDGEEDPQTHIFSVIPQLSKNGQYYNWFNGSPNDETGVQLISSINKQLGIVDKNNPNAISIYPTSFENKDYVISIINEYNQSRTEESQKIQYSDLIGMMMSSITVIIDAITYVLIAFVSISLVVSSIMIGVITYISVLERTKEIGVLRAMGASKKDIARVFNAETIIIGFISGILGIGITVLLNIPISLIVELLAGIPGVSALPWIGGISLIFTSVLLTLIAGIIPSTMASKKDPVIALRSE